MWTKIMKSMIFGCVAAVASGAWGADNNWTAGGGDDTKVSTTGNWSSGVVPGDNMRFTDAAAGKTVTFDAAYTINNYLWVGSTAAGRFFTPATDGAEEVFNPVVWTAEGEESGLHQTRESFRIADAGNQNGALWIQSGRYTTDAELWVGKDGGKGKVVLDDGYLKANKFWIGWSASAYGGMIINGGKVETANDLIVGCGGQGSMILNGGEVVCKGTFYMPYAGGTSAVNLNGGVLEINSVRCGANTTASLLCLNGGILKANANHSSATDAFIPADEHLTVKVGAGGAIVDTDVYTVEISHPLVSGVEDGIDGGLVKQGRGRLRLTGDLSYTGPTRVVSGVLELKTGTVLAELTMREDNALVYFADATAADMVLLTVKNDISAFADKFVCKGYKTTVVQENENWVVKSVAYTEDEAAVTYWVGGVSGAWTTAEMWSDGVPSETTRAVVLSSVRATIGADAVAQALVIGKGATFAVHKSDNWPALRTTEVIGEGTLALSSCGLKPIAGTTLEVYANVVTDATVAGLNQDCWIEGNDAESPFVLYGTIYAVDSAVRINQAMIVEDGGKIVLGCKPNDDNYFRASVLKAGGTIEILEGGWGKIESSSTCEEGSKVVVNGELEVWGKMTFPGDFTGAGEILLETKDGEITLSGNNEEFAGTITKPSRIALRLDSATAGSAKATWNIGGDIRSNVASGTIKFGQIDYHESGDWFVFYVENATGEDYLTLEIGAKGGNSNLGNADHICQGSNDSNLRIRKVGDGNLDLWFNLYKYIDIHEGTVSFRNNNGPSLEYNFTGGTMQLRYLPGWPFLDRIKNSTGPVDIDTCGEDLSMYQKGNIDSSNVGGLTKHGAGTLTFWTDLGYTGPTTVLEGTLCMWGGRDNAGGKVTVAEGAQLNLYATDLPVDEDGTTVLLKGEVDAESASRIVATGRNNEMVVTPGADGQNVIATIKDPDDTVPNRWVGLNRDNWTTSQCWSKGRPVSGQSIQIDYDCHIGNMNFNDAGSFDKFIIKAGVEAEFITANAAKNHPSINVNQVVVEGEGEATIALNHAGFQARGNTRVDTPENLNFKMTNTATDSWLRNWNLKGKLLGEGVFRSYACYLYGDNSEFAGKLQFLDDGSHICDVAASATNAVWELGHDIHFDVTEGVFKMGALDCHEQRVWYTKDGSTATIEVGHKNTDFGRVTDRVEDYQYFFGPETYDPAREVPEITFRKVGTGTWNYSGKGVRYIEVAEGALNLAENKATNDHFDSFNGKQIDTLVVCEGAALTGSSGAQPIYSLTMEPGSILKTRLSEVTTGDGDTAVTTVVQSAQPTVTGPVSVNGVIVDVEGADLVKADERYPLLTVTGEGNAMTGKAMLKDGLAFPAEGRPWCVKTKPQTLQLAEFYNFVITIR